MITIKSLILGSAAGLLAIGGAQAADLPVKAKAVEYVKICSLYGAGFYYIPGTDTCLKLGGYLRVDTTFNPGGTQGYLAYSGDPGLGDRYRNYDAARARLQVTVDTRTATEYGVVRTFGQIDATSNTYGGATSNPTALATNLSNTLPYDSPGGGVTGVEQLYLQFAGFTFGRSYSAYATPWSGYIANNSNALFGGDNYGTTGTKNIQYTAQFGNGVSATIGLDDAAELSRSSLYNLSIPLGASGTSGNAYAGVQMPDISANVKIDQAWGLFQLSGQIHEVNASYNTLAGSNGGAALVPADTVAAIAGSALSGHPTSAYGGAVMAALQIKNLPTGAGDDIKMNATYAKGDTHQVVGGAGASPSFFMLRGNTVGFGATTDGVYTPVGSTVGGLAAAGADGSIHLTTAVGFQGAFNHNWNPNWNTTIFGTQSWVKYDTTAAASYCSNYAVAVAGQGVTYSCNPNYSVSQIGTRTIWTPVAGLSFSAEAIWMHLGTSMSGSATLSPGAPYTAAVYTFKGQNTAELELRVQRNF